MSVHVDIAFHSLKKFGEELCGDKVEIVKTKDSSILILADGMGSGIRANILATLTSKILGTLFKHEITVDEGVETIVQTLPVSKVNDVAYSTFSILQIFKDGRAYLAEFDNPACIFLHNHNITEIPYTERAIKGKTIKECYFKTVPGDAFVLMSDGAIYAGNEEILNYDWTWTEMAEYAQKCVVKTKSAAYMTTLLSDICNDLYLQEPKDDTTVAVARVGVRKIVHLLTGPPKDPMKDEGVVGEFLDKTGFKIICGGTTSNIVAKQLGVEIHTVPSSMDEETPPISIMEGIDLVTEGAVTLARVLELLQQYERNDLTTDFFDELEKKNGASRITKVLIEDCTEIQFMVGTALNEANKIGSIPFDISVRRNLISSLEIVLKALDKVVEVRYY